MREASDELHEALETGELLERFVRSHLSSRHLAVGLHGGLESALDASATMIALAAIRYDQTVRHHLAQLAELEPRATTSNTEPALRGLGGRPPAKKPK